MKIREIYEYIDSFAPFANQCDWDNSGLLTGNMDNEVSRIGFALDPDIISINDAVKNNCDLIITHHPVIFRPLKYIRDENPVTALIKNNTGIICAHTNLDKSELGVNYVLADILGLKNAHQYDSRGEEGMCFIGEIDEMKASEFAETVSSKLNTSVEFTNRDKLIQRVAVCGDSAGDFIYEFEGKADAFVSGEFSYHELLDSEALNVSAVKAGHYATEYPVIPYLADKIQNALDIECVLLNHLKPEEYIGVNNAT